MTIEELANLAHDYAEYGAKCDFCDALSEFQAFCDQNGRELEYYLCSKDFAEFVALYDAREKIK